MSIQRLGQLVRQNLDPMISGKNVLQLLVHCRVIMYSCKIVLFVGIPLCERFMKRLFQQIQAGMKVENIEKGGAAAPGMCKNQKGRYRWSQVYPPIQFMQASYSSLHPGTGPEIPKIPKSKCPINHNANIESPARVFFEFRRDWLLSKTTFRLTLSFIIAPFLPEAHFEERKYTTTPTIKPNAR